MPPSALTWSSRALAVTAWASALLFGVYILSFYALATVSGDLARWNRVLPGLHESGGAVGNAGFGLYGVLMLLCAVQIARFAWARKLSVRRAWAVRLYALALVGCHGCQVRSEGPQPCGRAADPAASDVADGAPVPILTGIDRLDCALDGVLTEELLTRADGTEEVYQEESPFAVLALAPEPVPQGYHAWFGAVDRCYRHLKDHDMKGGLDLGRDVELAVGPDELALKYRKNWAPGESLYIYDPNAPFNGLGATIGAELVLEGAATGARVPAPMMLDPAAYQGLLETGVLDARWTPGGGDDLVRISLRLYDTDFEMTEVVCMVGDDGRALVDVGFDGSRLRAVELNIGRTSHGLVDHEKLGLIFVMTDRYQRFVELDLMEDR